jgi:hypothetical protein
MGRRSRAIRGTSGRANAFEVTLLHWAASAGVARFFLMKAILSLCDYSGNWARFYERAGYYVVKIDLKRGTGDVRLLERNTIPFYGILAAPPCDAFAGSGAHTWRTKDGNGLTLEGLAIVDACLRAVVIYKPHFWALENPVGRLRRYLGPPRVIFNPHDYGDPYAKRTCLWGDFNIPRTDLFTRITTEAVAPVRACDQGSWMQTLSGQSRTTKYLRSKTPLGFAQAFFEANQ